MNILIINGHPDAESFTNALADAYQRGAQSSKAQVRRIDVRALSFSPNLQFGYRKRTDLEEDLQNAQQDILWSHHIVLLFPVWWGSVPALLKGFIDRVFLPGFAFKKREGSLLWDKLLQGRTARIITTMDQPGWYYRLVYARPTYHAMKKLTLEFCGIKPVRVSSFGPLRQSTETFRQKVLTHVVQLGVQLR